MNFFNELIQSLESFNIASNLQKLSHKFRIHSSITFHIIYLFAKMIKTGRPAFHVKAKWIHYTNDNGSVEFYQLTKSGDLVKEKDENYNEQIIPHHVVHPARSFGNDDISISFELLDFEFENVLSAVRPESIESDSQMDSFFETSFLL